MSVPLIHLAAALDGAGWHPAAWRDPAARPADLFTAGYWRDLAVEAERGTLDFVTIEDAVGVQSTASDGPDGRTDHVRGRLDAIMVAARIAPATERIGLIPTGTTTHTEPFHLSTALATLDHVSLGRAGWQVQISRRRSEAAHFGRRDIPEWTAAAQRDPTAAPQLRELYAEAGDAVEVVRRLWDSWQDDAVIRDVATGRYIDRDRLHYVDFTGRWFSVRGPSITPRPPQGQPVVTVAADSPAAEELAARHADVAFITPHDVADVRAGTARLRAAQRRVGRSTDAPLRVLADLTVLLDGDAAAAVDRRDRLDAHLDTPYAGDAAFVVATPRQLAAQLAHWHAAGIDGFRLRPAVLPHDLVQITTGLVPALRELGLVRPGYAPGTLRERLRLPAAVNRYTLDTASDRGVG